ncbi:MAG: hypothetical protein ABFS56_33510, partial [Pseudomonadota bacterium]
MSHRKKRLKKTEVRSQKTSRIEQTKVGIPLGSSFSFKYFQADHDKFYIHEQEGKYLQALLERLRELSKLT